MSALARNPFIPPTTINPNSQGGKEVQIVLGNLEN